MRHASKSKFSGSQGVSSESDLLSSAARREIVDLVAEARSRAVRVALFGEMLHRPDPDGQETAADREEYLSVLLETVRWLDRTESILRTGQDPWNELSDEVCVWLHGFVKGDNEIPTAFARMVKISNRVATAAQSDPADLGAALRAHFEARRTGFMTVVTAFCERVWNAIDDERDGDMTKARAAISETHRALQRMESISKHVRLVAINSSIEASKLGDEGGGIGVIAAEFKSLAEELQALSGTARHDIAKVIEGLN